MKRLICRLLVGAMCLCSASEANAAGYTVIQDGTNLGYTLTVNSDGSINVNAPATGIVVAPLAITPTDRGGTITLGGTAQTLAASNTSRKVLLVLNPCTATGQGIAAAEDIFISVTGSATVNGASNFADLPPCASATVAWNGTVITAAVTVNAATTNHRWSATEAQ